MLLWISFLYTASAVIFVAQVTLLERRETVLAASSIHNAFDLSNGLGAFAVLINVRPLIASGFFSAERISCPQGDCGRRRYIVARPCDVAAESCRPMDLRRDICLQHR
jgi:hypothetical protein